MCSFVSIENRFSQSFYIVTRCKIKLFVFVFLYVFVFCSEHYHVQVVFSTCYMAEQCMASNQHISWKFLCRCLHVNLRQ